MRHLVSLFILLAALWLASCSPEADALLPTTSLTVVVAQESSLPQSFYPLSLTVRTADQGVIKAESSIASPGQSSSFTLPTWMRYQLIVRPSSASSSASSAPSSAPSPSSLAPSSASSSPSASANHSSPYEGEAGWGSSSSQGPFASTEVILRDQPLTIVLLLSADSTISHGTDTISIPLDDPIDTIPSADLPVLDRWPSPCSLWNGHVIALVDSLSPHRADLLLLSFFDWSDIPSANAASSDSTLCLQLAEYYQEFDLTGWRIPTADQARALHSAYERPSPAFDSLNTLLSSIGAPSLLASQNSKNIRYLCDEGHKSFSFASGTTISNAGTKSTDYRLRLVYLQPVYIR